MRYEFLGEFKPQIFIKILEPEDFSGSEDFETKKLTAKLEERLIENLDGLKTDVTSQSLKGYEKLL